MYRGGAAGGRTQLWGAGPGQEGRATQDSSKAPFHTDRTSHEDANSTLRGSALRYSAHGSLLVFFVFFFKRNLIN